MIERKFVKQNMKEFEVKEYVAKQLSRVGLSDVKLQRTPLGEKIIISASRPGLVVGRGGANITKLTKDLKEKFNFENPQIEIDEVAVIAADANIVAEMIANSLERFGPQRFKGIGHKAMAVLPGSERCLHPTDGGVHAVTATQPSTGAGRPSGESGTVLRSRRQVYTRQ